MSILTTNYTVTWANNVFTITWASIFPKVTFSGTGALFLEQSGNLMSIGPSSGMTWLDWTFCTSPSAGNKTALLAAISALGTTFNANTIEAVTGDLTLKTDANSANIILQTKPSTGGGAVIKSDAVAPLVISSTDGTSNVASFLLPLVPGNNVYSFPTAGSLADPFITQDSTSTMTNKTLTQPIIAALKPTAGTQIVFPVVSDTVVCQQTTDFLSNKSLSDANCSFSVLADTTKKLNFSLGGATTGKTMTIVSSHTNTRNLTLPDVSADCNVQLGIKNTVTQNNASHAALTAAQSGSLVKVTQDGGYNVTLPAVTTAGLNFTFILNGAAANAVNIVPASGTTFVGNVMQPTGNVVFQTAKGNVRFVSGTAVNGDKVYVESDGSVWSVQAYSGANGGIILV